MLDFRDHADDKEKKILNRDGIHGQSPLKGILSEHSEPALMFIKNSFQTTALTWILSLGKKLSLQLRKNRFTMEKPSGHLKEHRAARWIGKDY